MGLKRAKSSPHYFGCTIALLLVVCTFPGCGRTKKFHIEGQVVSKSVSTREITVNHEDIPGFMSAMTMPYRVRDETVFPELQAGDKIAAEVVVGRDPSDYWLEEVRITDQSGRGQVKSQIAPRMLTPGQHVPDIALINQDGRTVHLSDFVGKAVLVGFLYTRCPAPNFCPRVSSQFARIHNELKKSPEDYKKTHLLTVSFDPKYDVPTVLRKYGLAYLDGDQKGFSHWDFASTSTMDLGRMAQAFGLQFEQQDNRITHTMSIVLIGPDGNVANFWSTDWTWSELMESMQHAAHPNLHSRNN